MLQGYMTNLEAVSQLSDQDLLSEVKVAAAREREATARLVALLAHVDARRLYLGEGCSSLFTYCTHVLNLSEHAAYGRIEAARAARKFPVVLDLLTDCSLTLTTVTLLAPHLTPANHRDVLNEARHQGKREVEHLVARLRPVPPVPATVRKLPAPAPPAGPIRPPAAESTVNDDSVVVLAPRPPRPAVVTPIAPERYKVQFTVSRETHDKLRRVQELLRHSIPNGDVATIFDRALTVLLADLERAKLAASARPHAARPAASGSRHVPAVVKREVWKRDGGQCAFVGTEGRCAERGFLEFHHVQPYADGGATVVENLELRCRAHNIHEAEQYFGGRLPLLLREASRPAYCIGLGPDRVRNMPLIAHEGQHRPTEPVEQPRHDCDQADNNSDSRRDLNQSPHKRYPLRSSSWTHGALRGDIDNQYLAFERLPLPSRVRARDSVNRHSLGGRHSPRNAIAGSTRAARTAGISAASTAVPSIVAATRVSVAGSLPVTPTRKPSRSRPETIASTTPATSPGAAFQMLSPTIRPAMPAGDAPSARRTPISRVRLATSMESTPYTPSAASASAAPEKPPMTSAVTRRATS
jgi:hypothetical protein